MNNQDILNKLILFELPLQEIKIKMKELPWDDVPQAILTEKKLKAVINKYLGNDIIEADLIEWANIIECREDIEFEKDKEEEIKAIIFQIANPELTIETTFKDFISSLYECTGECSVSKK